MPGPQNKTVTEVASTAVVYTVQFLRDPLAPSGPISASINGQVSLSDGTVKQLPQPAFQLPNGAFETAVRNMMDGVALTRLRTVEGIEAP